MLLTEKSGKLQFPFSSLNDGVGTLDILFIPPKCKALFPGWNGLKPNIVLTRMDLDVVDKFCYLDSSILAVGHLSHELLDCRLPARSVPVVSVTSGCRSKAELSPWH